MKPLHKRDKIMVMIAVGGVAAAGVDRLTAPDESLGMGQAVGTGESSAGDAASAPKSFDDLLAVIEQDPGAVNRFARLFEARAEPSAEAAAELQGIIDLVRSRFEKPGAGEADADRAVQPADEPDLDPAYIVDPRTNETRLIVVATTSTSGGYAIVDGRVMRVGQRLGDIELVGVSDGVAHLRVRGELIDLGPAKKVRSRAPHNRPLLRDRIPGPRPPGEGSKESAEEPDL